MQTYLIDGIRTPIGSFGGTFSVRADDLAAHVLAELLKRNPQLDPASPKPTGCLLQPTTPVFAWLVGV